MNDIAIPTNIEDVTSHASFFYDKAVDMAITYGPKLLLAVLVYFIGFKLVKLAVKVLDKVLRHQKVDESLRGFLESLLSIFLKAIVLISVGTMIGIETTSFIAILGAAGLAVGLALQGSLANFAGGVLVLLFKPYKVGDLIEAQGAIGVVKQIEIFNTVLLNPENKTIIVPNGAIANGNIINYTKEGTIRVDLTIGISYDSDIKKAREIMLKLMQEDKNILSKPEPTVAVSELADSSVNLAIRPWCKPEHYWDVYFGTLEKAKEAFDNNGVGIPYPHQEVFMHQVESKK